MTFSQSCSINPDISPEMIVFNQRSHHYERPHVLKIETLELIANISPPQLVSTNLPGTSSFNPIKEAETAINYLGINGDTNPSTAWPSQTNRMVMKRIRINVSKGCGKIDCSFTACHRSPCTEYRTLR
jgi:hypothetical protein